MFNCTNREGLPVSRDIDLHKNLNFLLNVHGKNNLLLDLPVQMFSKSIILP